MGDKTLWFINSGGVQALGYSTRSGVSALKLHDSCPSAVAGLGSLYISTGSGGAGYIYKILETPENVFTISLADKPGGITPNAWCGYSRNPAALNKLWAFTNANSGTSRAFFFDGSTWTEYSAGMQSGYALIPYTSTAQHHFGAFQDPTTGHPVLAKYGGTPLSYRILYFDGTAWQVSPYTSPLVGAYWVDPHFSYYSSTVWGHVNGENYGISDGTVFDFSGVYQKPWLYGLCRETPVTGLGASIALESPISSQGYTEFLIRYSYYKGFAQQRFGCAVGRVTGLHSLVINEDTHTQETNGGWTATLLGVAGGNYWGHLLGSSLEHGPIIYKNPVDFSHLLSYDSTWQGNFHQLYREKYLLEFYNKTAPEGGGGFPMIRYFDITTQTWSARLNPGNFSTPSTFAHFTNQSFTERT